MTAVFTIEPNEPFLDCLIRRLLEWDRERLADTLLLLPTRRACLAARETFLRLGGGVPRLLPRLVPIGEPDEAPLLIDPGLELTLPPAIAPLRRRLLLTRLILACDPRVTHEQAIRLAGELERFLDETHNEEVDPAALDDLAPADFAEHWQQTLRFLGLLRDAWPRVLEAEERLDPARRRRLLLDALRTDWLQSPPTSPVVAAGITGTIPSVARLLTLVARLPEGAVVVPALDLVLDEPSWQAVGPSHPQYGLKRLLEAIGVERAAVRHWSTGIASPRTALWRHVLRPAATTESWPVEPPPPGAAMLGLERIDAPDLAEEALQIALRLRAAAEAPGRRAVLVTANRQLGRRVAAELLRWGMEVDDSAGVPLDQSPPGTFLLLTAHMLADGATPVPLLAALKHPLAAGGLERRDFRRHVRALERAHLRGPQPTGGLEGLRHLLRARGPDDPWPAPVPPVELVAWLDRLADAAAPMLRLTATVEAPLTELLAAHLAFAEWLAADAAGDSAELWTKEAGACAHEFVGEFGLAAEVAGAVPTTAYPALLAMLMASRAVRPRTAALARIGILGQLESRLVQADLVILGGLNEGTAPPLVDAGPWLNRAMRRQLGLPPAEQAIGFAAHDFLCSACAPEVVLSRAAKDEVGAPTTPSRWLARLGAVLDAAGARDAVKPTLPWAGWAARLDLPPGRPRPIARPEPRPPLAARPRSLSATEIERLMRDPYAIYARHVLKLDPLDPIDADPGGAERGQIIHAVLDEFVRACPPELPEDADALLLAIGRRHFARQAHRPQVGAIWWPRFERVAAWFLEVEKRRRAQVERILTETRGGLQMPCPGGPFRIRARADRIEVGRDGALAILDYKTGSLPANSDVQRGLSPQLLIEALIAQGGGFAGIPADSEVDSILYLHLKGGEAEPGKEHDPVGTADLRALLAAARRGIQVLLAHFDDPATAYMPVPRPEIAPVFSDYEHLSRLGEWWGAEADA